MLKFLIILGLIIYVLYKVGGFLFRTLFMSASQFQQQQQRQYKSSPNHSQSRKARDSNLNIDYVPKEGKKEQDGKINGGDYVDFEEVD